MNLTAIFLLSVCIGVQAAGTAQTVSLSEKNAPLEKVIQAIKKQTGYTFLYKDEVLKKVERVDIDMKNASIEKVLDACFKNQPVEYKIIDKTIVLKLKEPVTVNTGINPGDVSQPPPIVHGRITNEKGEPVAGVNISIKGGKVVGVTNDNGEFTLNNIADDAVLVFSAVSIEIFEVKLNGRTELALNSKTKVSALEDVSVSVNTGYQTIPKERAPGSFSTVNSRILNNRTTTDIISRLEGITSGLVFNVTPSGNKEIGIRGRNTIFANASPLIVLDNFPYEGDLNNINPNDVENITVLKDAAAASIWGVRAGNGVIVITTKRGHINQPLKVMLNSNISFGEKPDLFYDRNFINADEFVDFEKKLFTNGYYDADINNMATYPVLSPVVEILLQRRNNQISQTEADSRLNALRSLDIRNDIGKYFYRNSFSQQHALSLYGGSNMATYYLSVGYDKNLSAVKGNDYDRKTFNFQNTFTPFRRFELSGGIIFTQTNTIANGVTTVGFGNKNIYPYAQLVSPTGIALALNQYRNSFAEGASSNGFLDWTFLPLSDIENHNNETKNNDIQLSAGIKYSFFDGLSAEIKYQGAKSITEARNFNNEQSYFVRNLTNQYATLSGTGQVTRLYNIPKGGILAVNNKTLSANSLRGQLNYVKSFKAHSINFLAGAEVREIVSQGSGDQFYGYKENATVFTPVRYDTAYNTNPSLGPALIPNSQYLLHQTDRFRSYFFNGSYSYLSRYTLSASGRIDQSNFFGVAANQRSVPLWSLGGKWDMYKESFFKPSIFSRLSLRATYGYNGNLNKSFSAFTTAFETGPSFVGLPYLLISNPPNPGLRWEKNSIFNIGLDFSMKGNLLSGSLEYYTKKGLDLIGDDFIAPSTGFINPVSNTNVYRGNFADMKGSGVDLQLNSINTKGRLNWETNFLLSYATDKVTHYGVVNPLFQAIVSGNGSGGRIVPIEDKPVFAIYSYKWAGLDPATGDPRGYDADTVSKNYSLINFPVQLGQLTYSGPARPVVYGGMTNSLSWKNFTLSVNISFKFGYYFRRNSINYSALFNSYVGNADYSSRWKAPGDERNTNVPSMPATVNDNRETFYQYSEVLVEKADHIRLQYIYLDYRFKHISLYANASNLGILWRANKYGIDPDYTNGIPAPKLISLGVKAEF